MWVNVLGFSRRNWAGRSRYGQGAVRRDVPVVRVLKIALPCLAVALIALAVAWPVLFPEGPAKAPRMAVQDVAPGGNDVRLIKPRYGGTDARGRPFLVTAESATQDRANPDLIHLANLQADITLTDGAWFSLIAPTGLYRIPDQALDLTGGVDVFSDRGYELHAPNVRVDLGEAIAEGTNGVHGQGPFGHMRAERYRFERDRQHLILTGRVHVTYSPGSR